MFEPSDVFDLFLEGRLSRTTEMYEAVQRRLHVDASIFLLGKRRIRMELNENPLILRRRKCHSSFHKSVEILYILLGLDRLEIIKPNSNREIFYRQIERVFFWAIFIGLGIPYIHAFVDEIRAQDVVLWHRELE